MSAHLPCPYTACGSSDAFSYDEVKGVGYCHSCGTSYPSNKQMFDWAKKEYPPPAKKKDVMQQEVSSVTYEGIRSIDPEVCKIYGIQLQLDAEGNPVRYAFKHKETTKYRGYHEKKFWLKDRVSLDTLYGPDFNAGGKRIYLTEGECFTPDTEVLTPSGWKSFELLEDDDKVMQVDSQGYGSFVDTLAIVDKHYKGDLIQYTSGSYKSLTTENHMLVRINEKGVYTKYPATRYKHLPVPRGLVLTDPTEKLEDTLKYQLWIMLSADFTFRETGDIYGAFNKTRKIERVKHLLDKAGVRYVANVDSRGMTGFCIHRGHNLGWAKKELPWELITRKDRLTLLQELIHWDGNKVRGRNQVEFSSKLKHNADVVQALAHSCGYTSTIMLRNNQFGSWYKVSILFGKATSTTQKGYTRIPYSGRVMCVTVPSGMILVRQEGSISVSGNCDAASLYQVLGKTYPVLSLPSASISEKFIKKNIDYIKSFQEVVYAGELDEAGRKAAEKIYAAIPEKFWYVPLTKWKDANEFLMNGDGDALKWAALKPQRYAPDNFFCTDEAVEKAIREENPYEYVPTGHSAWDEKMRGLIKGGITFIKAPRGTGKCLHPDQGILMYDGSIVKAKDIKVNDKIMGDDSTPRTVLSTVKGREEMFKITPVKGEPWICNRSHILCLYHYDKGHINISVDEYLKLPESQKARCVQYRTGVDFKASETNLPFDPYLVGIFLGDGSKHKPCITLGDKKVAVKDWLYKWADDNSEYEIRTELMKGCVGYSITTGRNNNKNPFKIFVEEQLINNTRRIPNAYKTASKTDRQKLLAGLLDTDGYFGKGCFDIIQKSEQLADDICFVARSLGMAAYKKKCQKGVTRTDFVGNYYRVSISGDFTDLPLLRHKPTPRKQIKNVLRTGFTLESLGEGDYCGFELDGNRKFLLDDFTVTHNTELVRYFEVAMLKHEDTRIALLHAEEMKSTTYRAMATYHLGANVRTKDDARWNNISEDDVVKAAQESAKGERTIIFEMRANDDPMKILEYVRLAATVYGADFVFVDHVQRLAYLSQTGVDGATALLTALGSRMAQLCKELNIGVIFISQVNDDGRTKYAAALEEEAIVCVLLERDIESEDEVERNTTRFKVDKNRPFSKLGDAGAVFWNEDTTILEEVD